MYKQDLAWNNLLGLIGPKKQPGWQCRAFAFIRKCFFGASLMKDLFKIVNIDEILSFLREIKLYKKL